MLVFIQDAPAPRREFTSCQIGTKQFPSFPTPYPSFKPAFVSHSTPSFNDFSTRENPLNNSVTFLAKAKPLTTSLRPPKLLNRSEVVRQVSHCGKPQRTGGQPLGCFLNLPDGLCPLGSPSKSSTLCTLGHTKCLQILRKVHRTFLHIFHHFAKGLLALCTPRQRFHPCNLVCYVICYTLCNIL